MEAGQWNRRELLAVAGAAGLAALGVTTPLAAGPASNYEKVVLAKKPVAYWRLVADPDEARAAERAEVVEKHTLVGI
jgi:hypothetical protein